MPEIFPQDPKRKPAVAPQLRRLLILQFKLYIDAFRDICLSVLSLGAFLIDVFQGNEGSDCYFDDVMKLGRRTERAINLFDQVDPATQEEPSVDSLLRKAEDQWPR